MTLRGIHQWAHRNRPYEDYLQQVYDGVWHVVDARPSDPTFADGGLRGAVRLTSVVEHAGLGDPGRPALFAHGLMADLRETGNGVGTQLLTGIAHLARERGLSLIRISCVESLIPFYTKFGFRLTGATTSFPTSPPIVTYVMDYEVS